MPAKGSAAGTKGTAHSTKTEHQRIKENKIQKSSSSMSANTKVPVAY